MGTGHLDTTCIVSIHYTVPVALQCWENGVSWWQSLELQEQCHLDPAGMAIVAMAIVAMAIVGLGHQDLPAILAVDPPSGALDLDMAVDPSLGALDLPAITADRAVAQNEQDNDNAWPHWKRKIA